MKVFFLGAVDLKVLNDSFFYFILAVTKGSIAVEERTTKNKQSSGLIYLSCLS
jgi:hypothetical protein